MLGKPQYQEVSRDPRSLIEFTETSARSHPVFGKVRSQTFRAGSALDTALFEEPLVAVISTGAVGLQHILKDGRRSISTIFLAGEVLDFEQLSAREGTLNCLSPVVLKLFKQSVFRKLEQEDSKVRQALTDSFYRHCRFTTSHCVDLARKSAVEKLASFIFECRSRTLDSEEERVCLLLKRIDIADYMGLRPETLSRAFAKLRERGLIEFEGIDFVRVLDESALKQIAAGASAKFGFAA